MAGTSDGVKTSLNKNLLNDMNNATQTEQAPKPQSNPELNARFGVAVYSTYGFRFPFASERFSIRLVSEP
jgi:hypothetical protein